MINCEESVDQYMQLRSMVYSYLQALYGSLKLSQEIHNKHIEPFEGLKATRVILQREYELMRLQRELIDSTRAILRQLNETIMRMTFGEAAPSPLPFELDKETDPL